ncbi:MAG: hypothetical protein Tsb0015_08110 [Simkaniaceae bacterium]
MNSLQDVSFSSLPQEMKLLIFDFLPEEDLGNASMVCKNFFQTIEKIWREKTMQDFGAIIALGSKTEEASWKKTYKLLTESKQQRLNNLSKLEEVLCSKIAQKTIFSAHKVAAAALGMPDNADGHYYLTATKQINGRKIVNLQRYIPI